MTPSLHTQPPPRGEGAATIPTSQGGARLQEGTGPRSQGRKRRCKTHTLLLPWLCLCSDLRTSPSSSLKAQQEVSSGHGPSRKPRPCAGEGLCLCRPLSQHRACRLPGSRAGKLVSQAPQVTLPSTQVCGPWRFKLPFRTACNAIFLWLFTPVTHSSVHWEEMRTDGKRAQGSLRRVADRRLSFSCHYVSSGMLCCTWITQKNLNCYNLYPATDEGKRATWKDQEQEVTAGRAATQCAEHSGAHRAPPDPSPAL